MPRTTAADILVEKLAAAGVKIIYDVVGDSLNSITDSLQRKKNIQWTHIHGMKNLLH